MCFLPSLRDLIRFDDWHPLLKRRAIVGCPGGTSVSFRRRFVACAKGNVICHEPENGKSKKIISRQKQMAGIASRRWPGAEGVPLLDAVLANFSDKLMRKRKLRTKFSRISKMDGLQNAPPIVC
jgi:hypothetical protein